jgi:two-component system, chemotaxis family, sensor histidine kinase and response regulator WspE
VSPQDLSGFSMLDLFRLDAEAQAQILTAGLLGLERDSGASDHLEACMRCAHSIKGAARVVNLTVGVRIAHAMEECFVAAQQGRIVLQPGQIDHLLGALDLLTRMAAGKESELAAWTERNSGEVEACLSRLDAVLAGAASQPAAPPAAAAPSPDENPVAPPSVHEPQTSERVLRISAEGLNRLLALSGESLVESRWVKPFGASLSRLKKLQDNAGKRLEQLRETVLAQSSDDAAATELLSVQRAIAECQQVLSDRLTELDMFDRRSSNLSRRLYDEALACRMRPFGDGVRSCPRTVRDLGRSLGKQARLDIIGEATQVDRDLLEQLDAPLGHLLRNAVDHGLESPEERRRAGKPEEGVIQLEARHHAGRLLITITDDGRGIDLERLRTTIVERNLTTVDAARGMSEPELLEFLFLPRFTMKDTVTDTSGRGVGLDAVRDMVKQVRGTVRLETRTGSRTSIQLQLPVTLSVVRVLLADIGGEPYAFPLTSVLRAVKVPVARIQSIEGRRYFDLDGRAIGLIAASQVLDASEVLAEGDDLSVIVLGDATHAYGLSVDRFLFERELVVQPLDSQLGKVRDIAAGALMEDGSPVLIVDADDLLRSTDKLVEGGTIAAPRQLQASGPLQARKRVLVVDDSLTVRELERKLLANRGYEVEVAVDGVDGWNAVRGGQFNLVVTDVDMPRMDGIELVELINRDPNLKSIPVMVVSYKDRDEDRRRGLDAGAAYYLTKGSFHDETLLQAVVDLIGEAAA